MKILVIDSNYLCYRTHFVRSTRNLSFEGVATGCIYGFLRDVLSLMTTYRPDRIAFCFDVGQNIRKLKDPGYKASRGVLRNKQTPEQKKQYKQLQKQITKLREKILPNCGFRNVFWQEGYEADDLIASITKAASPDDEVTIVSGDHDLFQLLTDNVRQWTCKQLVTISSFHLQHGIDPCDWAHCKAIAGCSSDDVVGIAGVGEKTAAAYLRGELADTSKAVQKILEGQNRIKKNMKLVKLPYKGTRSCELVIDKVKKTKWRKVTKRYGMKSISKKTPDRTSN